MPPIVKNKVASAASRPASQTRRFESTLLMSLAASAAGASASASAAVSASASVSFVFISSFSGRRLGPAHPGAPSVPSSPWRWDRGDATCVRHADCAGTTPMRLSPPKSHSSGAEEEEQAPLGAQATHVQRVVREPSFGGQLPQRHLIDACLENQLRLV